MTLELAEAGPAHAEIVAALHAATVAAAGAAGGAAGGGRWSGAWVARILALPGAFAILALAPAPAGFVLCLPAGEAVDVVAIGVLPPHRRGGIGRRLLERCSARARRAGAARLMLEVAADNTPAIAFYRAAGFEHTGMRPRYYRAGAGGAPGDALVFAKSL